ncbi:MAG: hypothetical protein ACKOFA_01235, partial [Rhodoluna sp.]
PHSPGPLPHGPRDLGDSVGLHSSIPPATRGVHHGGDALTKGLCPRLLISADWRVRSATTPPKCIPY